MFCIGLPNMGDGIRMGIDAGAATDGLGMLQVEGPCSPRPLRLMIDAGDSTESAGHAHAGRYRAIRHMGQQQRGRFMDETIGHSPFVAANGVA